MKNVLKYVAFAALAAGFAFGASAATPVEYLEPVYKTSGVPASGIDHWVTNTVETYTVVASSDERVEWGTAGETKWYVVNGDVTIMFGVQVQGDVKLILVDGAKLSIRWDGYTRFDERASITVSGDGNSFTVYGQTAGTGTLDIESTSEGAGIGGDYECPGGKTTINGGTVTVRNMEEEGSESAGIGAGRYHGDADVTINGGTITVDRTEGLCNTAIGGTAGNGTARIAINGGMVVALGGEWGAGIGTADSGDTEVTINGGTITTTGGECASGIGGAPGAGARTITINGGTIMATGGPNDDYNPAGSGIGGSTVYVADCQAVKADNNTSPTTQVLHASPTTDIASSLNGKRYATVKLLEFVTISPTEEANASTMKIYTNDTVEVAGPPYVVKYGADVKVTYTANSGYEFAGGATTWTTNFTASAEVISVTIPESEKPAPKPTDVEYLAPVYKTSGVPASGIDRWVTNTVETYTVVTSCISRVTWGKEGETNWYVVTGGDFTISGGVICKGYINLILCNGANLTIANVDDGGAGIATDENGAFTIYGQPDGAGALNAEGGEEGAGIGGANGAAGSNITINGGTVTAIGGVNAGAGIGGGYETPGLNITINGGTVTATAQCDGAGIGGGSYENTGAAKGENITINGGVVVATGGEGGAGIGGGSECAGTSIAINGGTVTATGGEKNDLYGSGIGGGDYGDASNIYVADNILLKADGNNPPTTVITHTGSATDISSLLNGNRYTTAFVPVASVTINGVTTSYASITSAWEVAKTGTKDNPATLKLLTNVVTEATLETLNTTVLNFNLNQKTLSAGAGCKGSIIIGSGDSMNDQFSTITIQNGIITGSKDSAIYSASGFELTLDHVVMTGNVGTNGAALHGDARSKFLIKDCVFTNNTAIADEGEAVTGDTGNGGAIWLRKGEIDFKCLLVRTLVTDNHAEHLGGGVYFQGANCLAAGTMVRLADGTETAIENVKEGDVVKTFDHEGGTNSTARVYYAFKSGTKSVPFTLNFDTPLSNSNSSLQLSIVGCHDLLEQGSRKYVTITDYNVGQYIGAKFYGEDGKWHTLTNVTMEAEAVTYYSLYTAQHQNVYANGLLTVADDVDYLLNLYELDENLKADAEQLKADIAQYGLVTFEKARTYGMSREWYDDAGTKYLDIVIGKQLAAREYLEGLFVSTGRATEPTTVNSDTTGIPARPKLLAAAPLFASSTTDPTLDSDAVVSCLTLGTGAVITNNTAGTSKSTSNIHLAFGLNDNMPLIALARNREGIIAGVSRVRDTGRFTTNSVSVADIALFSSDKPDYHVWYDTNGYLKLESGIQVGDNAGAVIADGVCTVRGTGDMWSHDNPTNSPLWSLKGTITSVVIGDDVTSIGKNDFSYMGALKDVEIGNSVTSIAEKAFYRCTCATNLVVGPYVTSVGAAAFERCYSLETLRFGGQETALACQDAFKIVARITMDGDTPVVDAVPEVTIQGWNRELQGKTNLTDAAWIPIDQTKPIPYGFHFFKYAFVLPPE